ncbi:MAG TPA: hypothetical protein VGA62_09545, partial [Acidimicrobiia bacterium]
ATAAPTALQQLAPCNGTPGGGDPTLGALDVGQFLDTSANPPGLSYRRTPVPTRQPSMPKAKSARPRSPGAPVTVDVAKIVAPSG